jgi:hypothetical protein
MSNPLAVSVLAKFTHYYGLDGNGLDGIGSANLGTSNFAGYTTGKTGQALASGSRGYSTLTNPITIDVNTRMTLGGWFYFSGAFNNTSFLSVGYDFAGANEALYLLAANPSGKWSAGSWANSGALYACLDPNAAGQKYDFTVRCLDSLGHAALSPQSITIRAGAGNLPGWYFVVAEWAAADLLKLAVNGDFVVDTIPPRPAPRADTIKYFQIGNQFDSSDTPCKVEDVFFCASAVLTTNELDYLWSSGAGKSLAAIQADAT